MYDTLPARLSSSHDGPDPYDPALCDGGVTTIRIRQPAVGAIEPGRYADLLDVDPDRLADIDALLEEPTTVYKTGGSVGT